MTSDFIQIFKKVEDMEKIVLDNYIPKNGSYFKIDTNGEIENLVIKRNETSKNQLYKWFASADYYSSLIDLNKAVDSTKKIHSNNIYSLFIKCDILPEIGKNSNGDKVMTYESLDKTIDGYFQVLSRENSDKKVSQIMNNINLQELDKEKAEKNKEIFKSKIKDIVHYIKENNLANKEYVKVFIEEDIEKYKVESSRYLFPRIFNKNDYNVDINGEIFGLSNDNMGLNSKKPYLELKSTKFRVPYRLSLEETIVSKRIFEWLNNLTNDEEKPLYNIYIPLDFDFKNNQLDSTALKDGTCIYIHKTMNNGKTLVEDFEIINRRETIEPMYIKNYLNIDDFEVSNISTLTNLEEEIDKHFYSNKLRFSYYNNEVKPVIGSFSDMQLDILNTSKEAMQNYFRKGNGFGFISCLERVTREMIIQKFIDKTDIKPSYIAYTMNFRLNLLKYYKIEGKEDMGDRIKKIYDNISRKVTEDNIITCETDEEFYFAAGQVIRYLVSKSESQRKNHDLTIPFLQIGTAKKLKESITNLFEKYGYAVSRYDKRVNNLISMVMGYSSESKVKDYSDLLVAGICAKNIIYTKKEEDKKDENE